MSDTNGNIGNVSIIHMNRYLECPSCLNFAVNPIHSCDNGHVICGICADTIDECPTCDNKNLTVNSALERILQQEGVEIPCRNVNHGCSQKIKPSDMKQHLTEECDARPIHCVETKTNLCEKKHYTPKGIFEHWKEYHKIEKLNVSKDPLSSRLGTASVTFTLCQNWYRRATGCEKEAMHWPANYFEIDDNFFIMHMHSTTENIHFWVTMLAEEVSAKRYKFSASLSNVKNAHGIDKKAQIVWNDVPIHCLQFHDLEKIKSLGHTMILAYDTLKLFPMQDGEGYAWYLSVDISKAEDHYRTSIVENI